MSCDSTLKIQQRSMNVPLCNFILQVCNDHWRKCFAIVHFYDTTNKQERTHFTTMCNIFLSDTCNNEQMGTTHTYSKIWRARIPTVITLPAPHSCQKKTWSVRLCVVHTMLRKAIIKSDRLKDLRSSDWTEETNKWMRYHVMLMHTCSTK